MHAPVCGRALWVTTVEQQHHCNLNRQSYRHLWLTDSGFGRLQAEIQQQPVWKSTEISVCLQLMASLSAELALQEPPLQAYGAVDELTNPNTPSEKTTLTLV